MELVQHREKEIFETIKKIKSFDFVVIGGYAVNAYTLPRFSVDCDIVILKNSLKVIEKELLSYSYKQRDAIVNLPYHGSFVRYEKMLENKFKVSIDILIDVVIDRKTNASFSAEWVFENARKETLKGKTITEIIAVNVINLDALLVMKFISCRETDIRDIFMLIRYMKNRQWVKDEINKRYSFSAVFEEVKKTITSAKFKDNLQGVFGYIDNSLFEKHVKALLSLGE